MSTSTTPLARPFVGALCAASAGVFPGGAPSVWEPTSLWDSLDDHTVRNPLEERLRATMEDCQKRWPEIRLPQERYFTYVAERALRSAGAEPSPAAALVALGKLNLPDLYLACACAEAQPAALRIFDREILSKVPAFVSRLHSLVGTPALWIHGHTHDGFDYQANGTRVVANPMGYRKSGARLAGKVPEGVTVVFENGAFDPGRTVDV